MANKYPPTVKLIPPHFSFSFAKSRNKFPIRKEFLLLQRRIDRTLISVGNKLRSISSPLFHRAVFQRFGHDRRDYRGRFLISPTYLPYQDGSFIGCGKLAEKERSILALPDLPSFHYALDRRRFSDPLGKSGIDFYSSMILDGRSRRVSSRPL